jgi:GGDEF domain-containing protein
LSCFVARWVGEEFILVLCRAKKKVLTKPAPAEAKKATELKRAAELKKAAADPAGVASSRGESATVSKVMGATANSAEPVAGDGARLGECEQR